MKLHTFVLAIYLSKEADTSILVRVPSICAGCVELADAATSVWGTANIGPGKSFPDTQAKWIWSHANGDLGTSSGVRTNISTVINMQSSTSALLNVIVEAKADVLHNGNFVATVTGGWRASEVNRQPLHLSLTTGRNIISFIVFGVSYGGRAGLLASISSSSSPSVVYARTTGNTWTCSVDLPGSAGSKWQHPVKFNIIWRARQLHNHSQNPSLR